LEGARRLVASAAALGAPPAFLAGGGKAAALSPNSSIRISLISSERCDWETVYVGHRPRKE